MVTHIELVIRVAADWQFVLVGFSSLLLCDQMTLLQKTWLDIIFLNFAYRSATKPGTLVFSEDFMVRCDATCVHTYMCACMYVHLLKVYNFCSRPLLLQPSDCLQD